MFSSVKKNDVVLFVFLVYALTWVFWIPALVTKAGGGNSIFAPDQFLGQVGRWSPGIVAILLTLVVEGGQGVKKLLQPLWIWRVNIGWYAAALLLQPVIFLAARLLDILLGSSYQIESPLGSLTAPLVFVIPVLIVSSFPGSFAEELGWRGYALPRLQGKHRALIASINLAIFWGVWHIPSMVYFGQNQVWDIVFAVINFIPMTIIYTWLYNNTKSSLLLVTLLHVGQQLFNNFVGTIPTASDEVMTWLIAILLLVVFGMGLKRSGD